MKTKDGIEITKEDFRSYLRVQKAGWYNMFSSEARELTGLSKDTYSGVMETYNKLMIEYKDSYEEIMRGA